MLWDHYPGSWSVLPRGLKLRLLHMTAEYRSWRPWIDIWALRRCKMFLYLVFFPRCYSYCHTKVQSCFRAYLETILKTLVHVHCAVSTVVKSSNSLAGEAPKRNDAFENRTRFNCPIYSFRMDSTTQNCNCQHGRNDYIFN